MRVIVCDGRDFTDHDLVDLVLRRLPRDAMLIHGCARGADQLANAVWTGWDGSVERYPADWERFGKKAGVLRNQEMLDSGADLVIAFPGGKGTADMVRRAKAAKVRVWEVA